MPELKILLVICDGMGDRPVPQFNGRTPLEAATTPVMDSLAREGSCGLMHTIAPGVTPGSDTAHLALLGYDPVPIYTGRGPFEAMGIGMEVKPGDIAFRCNFATVDGSGRVRDRRAGRIHEGTKELAAALDSLEIEGVRIIFKEGVEHRAVLILRGEGLSPMVTDTDPHKEGVKVLQSRASAPEAEKTARVLNRFTELAHELLSRHDVNKGRGKPANAVLVRGAGEAPRVPSFSEKSGLSGAAAVGIPLVKGLCRFAGLEVLEVRGATGSTDTDFNGKAQAALSALKSADLVLLHYKAPDIYSHDRDPLGKLRGIETIDAALRILLEASEDTVIAVTADHTTPCSVGEHTADPVPLAIHSPDQRRDSVAGFSEVACALGLHGRIRGTELIQILKGCANRSQKFGA
ncbi:MAG: 2,3-bisphosphoglycerate-independent phosphoglycerate mutase [Candidatus Thermoplasmatota archaeon]